MKRFVKPSRSKWRLNLRLFPVVGYLKLLNIHFHFESQHAPLRNKTILLRHTCQSMHYSTLLNDPYRPPVRHINSWYHFWCVHYCKLCSFHLVLDPLPTKEKSAILIFINPPDVGSGLFTGYILLQKTHYHRNCQTRTLHLHPIFHTHSCHQKIYDIRPCSPIAYIHRLISPLI